VTRAIRRDRSLFYVVSARGVHTENVNVRSAVYVRPPQYVFFVLARFGPRPTLDRGWALKLDRMLFTIERVVLAAGEGPGWYCNSPSDS
jgi:hypothetical protein